MDCCRGLQWQAPFRLLGVRNHELHLRESGQLTHDKRCSAEPKEGHFGGASRNELVPSGELCGCPGGGAIWFLVLLLSCAVGTQWVVASEE
jgi:hypothetical protein